MNRPTSDTLQNILNDIAAAADYIWQKGWGERNGGNITVDITGTAAQEELTGDNGNTRMEISLDGLTAIRGRLFYVKGTQCRMRDLARDPMANGCIIRINDKGNAYSILTDNGVRPTSELPSHLIVQNYLRQTGSGYTATLHTHPVELVALSHIPAFLDNSRLMPLHANRLTKTLWSMIPETLAFAPLGIGIVPYQVPGSQELAQATLREILHYDVVLWEKHGTFAVGKDIMDAFDQTDVLNKAAQIYLRARLTGEEPAGMSIPQMQEIQAVFRLPKQR